MRISDWSSDVCSSDLLLQVNGKPLIVWHIERLVAAGITDLIINHAWLGSQIEQALADGSSFGAHIVYSPEPLPLETAGGIDQALPFLNDEPFLVINGDIWCDWNPGQAPTIAGNLTENTKNETQKSGERGKRVSKR